MPGLRKNGKGCQSAGVRRLWQLSFEEGIPMDKWDRRYLLSIEELLLSEGLEKRCLALVDAETKRRTEGTKSRRRRGEIIGAGLLLQLGLWEAGAGQRICAAAGSGAGGAWVPEASGLSVPHGLQRLTLTRLLEILEQADHLPLPIVYGRGEQGKPYLKNYHYHYNVSHSGRYVLCVLADREVGVDIQQREPGDRTRLVQRFFPEEERRCWETGGDQLFYRLWCRKEACAKLEGGRIGDYLARDLGEGLPAYRFEEYEFEDCQIAICWRGQEQETI